MAIPSRSTQFSAVSFPGGATLRGAVCSWSNTAPFRRNATAVANPSPTTQSPQKGTTNRHTRSTNKAVETILRPYRLPLTRHFLSALAFSFLPATEAPVHPQPSPAPDAPQSARGLAQSKRFAPSIPSYLPSLVGSFFGADQQRPRSFAPLGSAGTAQRSIPTIGSPSPPPTFSPSCGQRSQLSEELDISQTRCSLRKSC